MTLDSDPKTIPAWIERWARQTPDAPVLLEPGLTPLTYGRMAEICAEFRNNLNGLGYGPGDRIAVVLPGGTRTAVAIAGVWSTATAVPLNSAFTTAEFAVHFENLSVKALLTAPDFGEAARSAAAAAAIPVMDLTIADPAAAGEIGVRGDAIGPPVHGAPPGPDDQAHVLTTSGTTSRAKIVARTHSQVYWNCRVLADACQLTGADRCINLFPLVYSGGLNGGFGSSLVAGGSVILLPQFSADEFFRAIGSLCPTWYTGSPTFHQAVLAAAKDHASDIAKARLRFVRSGGAHLAAEIGDQIEALFGVPCVNGYGSSESGQIANNPPTFENRRRGSVGKPVTSVGTVAILDPEGREVAQGGRGEVAIKGPQVFDEYENDPEATAAAFVGEWYRTGDEGFLDADGFLFLTGRIKELINRGGQKISPPEVDDVLLSHPDVAQAATFPIPHPTLGEEIAAAIVLKPLAIADVNALSKYVRERLTGVKVPRKFLFVDEIPKGPTGKIQRRRLAEEFGLDTLAQVRGAGAQMEDRAPSRLEAQLQHLWAEALEVENVGLFDDFFLLGGDSLRAVGLFLEIERELGRKLPRSILFEAGTVADMARLIEADSAVGCVVPIQPDGDGPPLFCLPGRDGGPLIFRELALRLGESMRVYGIQSVLEDDAGRPFDRLEDVAAHFVREIRKIQPTGPYHLGGYSWGGRVAFEMAQQLRAAGDEVALLALFDAYSFVGRRRLALQQRLSLNVQRMSDLTPAQRPAFVAAKIRSIAAKPLLGLRRRLFATTRRALIDLRLPVPAFLSDLNEVNIAMNARYRPQPYDGDAVLFKATRFDWVDPVQHDGWEKLIKGRLDVEEVPSGHHDILREPHVRLVAHVLAERVSGAGDAPAEDREQDSLSSAAS